MIDMINMSSRISCGCITGISSTSSSVNLIRIFKILRIVSSRKFFSAARTNGLMITNRISSSGGAVSTVSILNSKTSLVVLVIQQHD